MESGHAPGIVQSAHQAHRRLADAEFLAGLAQRPGGAVLAGLQAPAGKCDLSAMMGEVIRPPGERQADVLALPPQRQQHRGLAEGSR